MKIGRHVYSITESDRFLDNDACVQLLTQSKENSERGHRPNPALSKKMAKKLKKITLIEYPYYSTYANCRLYGIPSGMDNITLSQGAKDMVKYKEAWTPPPPEKIREAIKYVGGQAKAALLLKKNKSTLHRWCVGTMKIDYANWVLLTGIRIINGCQGIK